MKQMYEHRERERERERDRDRERGIDGDGDGDGNGQKFPCFIARDQLKQIRLLMLLYCFTKNIFMKYLKNA